MHDIPFSSDRIYLTDGGLETTLVYQEGWDLPEFAAFPLLDSSSGRQALSDYYRRYMQIAQAHGVGVTLESPTWRASEKWGKRCGYDAQCLAAVNRSAIQLLRDLREANDECEMLVSGCIGPFDDGYAPDAFLTAEQAQRYHSPQAEQLANADLLCAMTLTYVDEAVGITRAAQQVDRPVVISFTVETDGRLPSGATLAEAIYSVDDQTDQGPLHYMVNCAHPSHFIDEFAGNGAWLRRIGGVRANASRLSHAELDVCTELDCGDPLELAGFYQRLRERLPSLKVLGGCCGTDHRHIEAIAHACL